MGRWDCQIVLFWQGCQEMFYHVQNQGFDLETMGVYLKLIYIGEGKKDKLLIEWLKNTNWVPHTSILKKWVAYFI